MKVYKLKIKIMERLIDEYITDDIIEKYNLYKRVPVLKYDE